MWTLNVSWHRGGSLDHYSESIGCKLGLPIISTLTSHADPEEGLGLLGDRLISLQRELKMLESYLSLPAIYD